MFSFCHIETLLIVCEILSVSGSLHEASSPSRECHWTLSCPGKGVNAPPLNYSNRASPPTLFLKENPPKVASCWTRHEVRRLEDGLRRLPSQRRPLSIIVRKKLLYFPVLLEITLLEITYLEIWESEGVRSKWMGEWSLEQAKKGASGFLKPLSSQQWKIPDPPNLL